MSNALAVVNPGQVPATLSSTNQEFVSMRLSGQLFGISVMAVQDVMRKQVIAPVPLARDVIAGSINVRGRIVTALNMRKRLGLAKEYPDPEQVMNVVVEFHGELYAFIVDAVGDVLSLPMKQFEKVPSNMDPAWRSMAAGVFKLEKELLIILDVARVIEEME
jgi:purine-binding chemotaxis protein CheW